MRDTREPINVVQATSAEAAQEAPADSSRLNRHRGLWSFLTRSFFLGQMLVALPALSRGAQASQVDGDIGAGLNATSDPSASTPFGPAQHLTVTGADDLAISSAANTEPAATIAGTPPQAFSAVDVSPVGGFQTTASLTVGAATQGSSTLVTSSKSIQGPLPNVALPEQPPQSGGPIAPEHPGHGINPVETIVETVVVTVSEPSETIVETVVVTLPEVETVAGTVVEPVLDIVDDVGSIVEEVLKGVDDTVDAIAELVDDTVDTLLSTVDETIDVVFDVLQGVTGALPLVGPVLAEIIDFLDEVVSPTLEDVSTTLSGAVDVVTDTLVEVGGVFSALGDAIGSDVIPAFTETLSNALSDPLGALVGLDVGDIVAPVEDVVSSGASFVDTLLDGVGNLSIVPVATLTEPLLEVVNDVGAVVEDVLEAVDETVGVTADLVDDTADIVVATIDEATDLVFDVVQDVTDSVPLVGTELTEVTDVVEDIVSSALVAVTTTVSDSVDVVTEMLADAGGIFSALGEAIGSDVVPALTDTVSDIFSNPYVENGLHTDLGVVLQSDIIVPVDDVVSGVDSVADTLLDGLGDLAGGDQDAIGTPAFSLTSPLSGLKSGFADLFG
ncbi:hypothetical protein [Hyphomicrobium sp. CS1GBMeth3]|uniref:hypothetical protein n=1 Tax=Hyphomicrobium sp. CS1GBMeth3 TaxID=1892845 RepID=UPI000931B624|nr:hypothetical protein [Hyphomicrobium sp. CS1GBMeth3]